MWRRRWDSNPRTLADQLISSQSRYDHFDTAPYLSQHQHLGKRGELMGRTSKNIKLRIPEKPHKIKGFRSGSYRVATTISSVLSIVEISRKSGAELEVGVPGKCSKIKCFWTSQRRQASRGKGSKNVSCSLRIWREIGRLERKLERKERKQRATHTRLVLVKQMR